MTGQECPGRDEIVTARTDAESVTCPACGQPAPAKVARWYENSVLAPSEQIEWRVSPHVRPS